MLTTLRHFIYYIIDLVAILGQHFHNYYIKITPSNSDSISALIARKIFDVLSDTYKPRNSPLCNILKRSLQIHIFHEYFIVTYRLMPKGLAFISMYLSK
jgi:hypothetical protein